MLMLRKTVDNLPHSLPYLFVTAISVALFYPTWGRLASAWLQFEQVLAHGLATAVIYLCLILAHPPKPLTASAAGRSWKGAGALVLILSTLAWMILELVRIDTLSYLMLPVGLLAVSWTLLGLQQTLRLLPYVILLALSLPIWADFVPALVALASAVVTNWVRIFGMTALIEGNSITLPYGRLIIADGCSGIRYFAISILLAALMSILNDYRWRGWLMFLAVATMLGLIANWVRIFLLVLIGYQTEMQSDLLTDHELLGWVVYGAFILPALYFAPVNRRSGAAPKTPAPIPRWGFAAIIVAFLAGPFAISAVQVSAKESNAWVPAQTGLAPAASTQLPIQLRLPDSLVHSAWTTPDAVWISIAQSQRSENTDHKLVPYLRPTINPEEWRLQEAQGNVSVYQHRTGRQRVAASQWYQVGHHTAGSYRDAKLMQIPATLAGASRFALVSILSECQPRHCDQAVEKVAAARTRLRLSQSSPEQEAIK